MTSLEEVNENREQNRNKKQNRICKICNVILSVVYLLCGWIFGLLGIMFFSLGLPDAVPDFVCSFVSSLLFLLTPVFCILGIVFSVLFRKKEKFATAILVQFLPFGTLGVALVSFFLSMVF